ncbi:MAG TPA: DUF998 domain-containing protein [Ktedonobacterales bacterium]|nr:DUF998 domain-containing protein [Ktedonobacterales bacterium]
MIVAPLPARPSSLRGYRRSVVFLSTQISLLGVLSSVGLVVALHFLRPDLNPTRRFISDYAIGPHGMLMNLAFWACGLGMLALVVGLYFGVAQEGRSWAGLALLTVSGVCILVATLFHDAPQASPAIVLDTVHDSIVQISLFSLALAALTWSIRFRRDKTWRVFARLALPMALMMLLALLGFILTPTRFLGLSERILLGLYLVWVCGVLVKLESLVPLPEIRLRRLEFSTGELAASWHSPEGQAPSSP